MSQEFTPNPSSPENISPEPVRYIPLEYADVASGRHHAERQIIRLEQEVGIDALTGLPNRRSLDDKLGKLIDREITAEYPQSAIGLIAIDLDNFKELNDRFGHAEGDKALKLVADTLRTSVRPTDIPVRTKGEEDDLEASRVGGDEFMIVIPDMESKVDESMTPEQRLYAFSERIRNEVMQTIVTLPEATAMREAGLGISIGAVHYRLGETIEEFKERADQAMYIDKRSHGGGR